MTRDSITYQFDYEVSFEYELGFTGSYERAPETHEIEVVDIYDNYTGEYLSGYEFDLMLGDVEDFINDYLNNL